MHYTSITTWGWHQTEIEVHTPGFPSRTAAYEHAVSSEEVRFENGHLVLRTSSGQEEVLLPQRIKVLRQKGRTTQRAHPGTSSRRTLALLTDLLEEGDTLDPIGFTVHPPSPIAPAIDIGTAEEVYKRVTGHPEPAGTPTTDAPPTPDKTAGPLETPPSTPIKDNATSPATQATHSFPDVPTRSSISQQNLPGHLITLDHPHHLEARIQAELSNENAILLDPEGSYPWTGFTPLQGNLPSTRSQLQSLLETGGSAIRARLSGPGSRETLLTLTTLRMHQRGKPSGALSQFLRRIFSPWFRNPQWEARLIIPGSIAYSDPSFETLLIHGRAQGLRMIILHSPTQPLPESWKSNSQIL